MAFRSTVKSKQCLGKLCTPGSEKSCNAKDLTRMDLKADLFKAISQTQVFHLQDCSVMVDLLRCEGCFLQLSSGHIINKLFIIDILCRISYHKLSISENSKLICNFKYFIQFMTDKQCGNSFFLQLSDYLEQLVNFLSCQCRGRFIHNDQLGIVQDRSGNGDQLLIRHRKLTNNSLQRQFNTNMIQCLFRNALYRFPIHKFPVIVKLIVDRNIFCNRQIRENGHILINYLDSQSDRLCNGKSLIFLSFKCNTSPIRPVKSGNNLDQR